MPMSIVLLAWGGMLFTFAAMWLICKTIVDGIRARSANRAGWDKEGNVQVPPMFDRMLDKAMVERDERIQLMEERIQVLEKIVTDGHKRDSLASEIEKLRG